MGIRPQRDPKRTRQPEIGQFQVSLLVDQQVLGFQIAMQDAVRVAVVDAADELVGEFLEMNRKEGRDVSWGDELAAGSAPMC